jgi:predicted helicase
MGHPATVFRCTLSRPMQPLNLKPSHKLVKSYYETLGNYGQLSIDHEMAVRSAFQNLLAGCGQKFHWTLVPEYSFSRPKLNPIRIDGALLDTVRLPRGYWEAKDEHDDLDKEIRAKLEKGYPKTNIIFQAPERAVLYQHGIRQGTNEDIRDPKNLVELLSVFFAYRPPHIEEWEDAVKEFKNQIPQIAGAVKEKIESQRRTNPAFVQRFDAFYELCRQSINPNLSVAAVEEMLIQHLMTERIFRRIFDNSDFTRRNVIAVEIEKIIDSMTAREFSRDAFLKDLDRFYRAIELAAENTETYKQKQDFINTVYERFFQGYSPKEADTHGIVYTPQPIVDFMVRSVEDILKKEFGRSLSDKDVHILDPFVGTGNFITRVMQEIKTSALPYKYENELHCNEVMLLPYYVASMNIEHEYLERTGEYKAFPGICLVDTFELAEPEQSRLSFMSEENTARVKRQKAAPIFVVIGNPPYNAGQVDENDNNKNRKYPAIDGQVSKTYGTASSATLLSKLQDPYVKAIRWASDRIGNEGIVAFVSNDSFVHDNSMDGMRSCLEQDFDAIYILDLGGNVRKNPKLSGTTHNVFGIQVGVSINLLVRKPNGQRPGRVRYQSLDPFWRKEKKFEYLEASPPIMATEVQVLNPDVNHTWITEGLNREFYRFVSLGNAETKSAATPLGVIFQRYSLGVSTNRDAIVYGYDRGDLVNRTRASAEAYNSEVARYHRQRSVRSVDDFLLYDGSVKWSEGLKHKLEAGRFIEFSSTLVRRSLYRPFSSTWLYYDPVFVDRPGLFREIYPDEQKESENSLIWVKQGTEVPIFALVTNRIPNLLPQGGSQCFPFYVYDEDGSNRRENITDWVLNEFRTHYSDANITKLDIFHYVYAVLHHPEYREGYAANLKRELPRIPFVTGVMPGSGSAGLQASVKSGAIAPSTLPKASAQPARAERHKETADPSASPGAGFARDDNSTVLGDHRGPSTPAAQPQAASAQDDNQIFWKFEEAGRGLAELHVNYEQQIEYPLEHVEKGQLNWRVEKMRLSKDKTTLVYNEFLTLKGIPSETYEYRLGNRSALE